VKTILTGTLSVLLLCSISFAQTNPFLSGQPAGSETTEGEVSPPGGPSTWPVIGTLVTKSAAAQRKFQITIAETMSDLTETGSVKSLWILLGISFVFGILHAAGPGHRKTVLVAYFMGKGTKPLKGILAGFMLAAVHAASAIVLVGGFYLFTTRSLLVSVDQAQTLLFPLTYGIILVLGIWMTAHGIKDYRSPQSPDRKNGSLGWLIFSGLVPCPAASAIMILAVVGNATIIGIISITAMSLGMGVLLASVGLFAILMRSRVTALLKNPAAGKKMELVLQLVSGAAMALFGLFMGLGYL
jgi:ABC-type nickel/cobalt efflux system permease component RcnA